MESTFLLNLGAALLMGVLIGLERQYGGHPAGLRTNTLVCVGAALFASLPRLWGHDLSPDHIVGQVVVGVGFLGGGVIMHEGLTVKGMNTGATLWCSAAVGALTGAGYPQYGAIGMGVVLAIHLALRPLARRIDAHTRKAANVETSYRILVTCERQQEAVVRTILMRHIGGNPGLLLQGIALKDESHPDQATVTAEVFSASRDDRAMENLISRIHIEPGVTSVRWEHAR